MYRNQVSLVETGGSNMIFSKVFVVLFVYEQPEAA